MGGISGRFVTVKIDWRLEPVGLNNQQITRQVFKRAFGCRADEQTFPSISSDSTHDDHVRIELFRDLWQFLVRQTGRKVRVFIGNVVERRDFFESLLMVVVHLLLDFIKR